MNWGKIKKKYPKCFYHLCQHFNDGIGITKINKFGRLVFMEDDGNELWISNSDIIYFFDKNNLLIHVFPVYFSTGDIAWNYQIYCGSNLIFESNNNYNTRQKVEHFAFKKAFKILEKGLKTHSL